MAGESRGRQGVPGSREEAGGAGNKVERYQRPLSLVEGESDNIHVRPQCNVYVLRLYHGHVSRVTVEASLVFSARNELWFTKKPLVAGAPFDGRNERLRQLY